MRNGKIARLPHDIRQELKREALAPFWTTKKAGLLADYFGGGEGGKKIADYIIAVENDLPLPKLDGEKPDGQAQSNPVKVKFC